MAWPEIAACVLFLGHVAIGEGLQVGDDGELLPVVQSKISYLGCVDVDSQFWGWPSRAGNVPCVVEMNDLLPRSQNARLAFAARRAVISLSTILGRLADRLWLLDVFQVFGIHGGVNRFVECALWDRDLFLGRVVQQRD